MSFDRNRRDILKLMGVGGVVFASGLAGAAADRRRKSSAGADSDFFFLQLSDTHWGYSGVSNPEADVTLPRAIDAINGVAAKPDFIVFTGDLTHTTDDGAVRRRRMTEFRKIAAGLSVKDVHFLPGEHDAAKDRGDAYQEQFGATHYTFDHKGVHFVALDNVSDPEGAVGAAQIDWLARDLKQVGRDRRIVILAHRPLFDLYPAWEWSTKDGAKVMDVLLGYPHVTVFYGHIHQEHHHTTEQIAHHAARSLVFALPAPGSVPKKVPATWDPAAPFKGLGYRRIDVDGPRTNLTELPVNQASAALSLPSSAR
ncbi:MAG TPA: metallophosphoesterase [Polyangia bacterium]|nr:metallophosphoesterase [Polyangia bacterium]